MATDKLSATQAEAIQKQLDAASRQTTEADQALNARIEAARGGVSDPGILIERQLRAFDEAAAQQRLDFAAGLEATYGTAFKQTQAYADQISLQETALGEERVAIVRQANEQIAAAWASVTSTDQDLNVRITTARAAAVCT